MRFVILGWLVVTVALTSCDRKPNASTGGASGAGVAVQFDASKVPEELRGLVSLAQDWGIGDDVARNAKVAQATPENAPACGPP